MSACLQDVLDCRRALALILRCVGVGAVLCIACEQFVGRAPGPRPGEATFACYIVHVCRTAFPMIFAKRSALKTGPRGSQPGPLPRSHRRQRTRAEGARNMIFPMCTYFYEGPVFYLES